MVYLQALDFDSGPSLSLIDHEMNEYTLHMYTVKGNSEW